MCTRMLLAILLGLAPGIQQIQAQDTRLFGDADKRAIEQLYDRYGQAFIMKDYNALRECVQTPFVLFADELRTLESAEAVLAMYQTLREALGTTGLQLQRCRGDAYHPTDSG